jgi:hypothetical protein
LFVIVSKIFVAFDFAIAHQQYGYTVFTGYMLVAMGSVQFFRGCNHNEFLKITRTGRQA